MFLTSLLSLFIVAALPSEGVDFEGLQKLIADTEEINLLDSREFEEYEVSHLKGAVHVGYKNFDIEAVKKKIDFSKTTIVYCSVGYRSGKVVKALKKAGVKALNFQGGIFDWVNKGGLVYSKEELPVEKVHGYNSTWSKKVKGGKAVLPKKKKWFFF